MTDTAKEAGMRVSDEMVQALDRIHSYVLHGYNLASQGGKQAGFESGLYVLFSKLRAALSAAQPPVSGGVVEAGIQKRAIREILDFIELFVMDGDPPALADAGAATGLDPNEFAQAWDAASKAIATLTATLTAAIPHWRDHAINRMSDAERLTLLRRAVTAGNQTPAPHSPDSQRGES